MMRKGTSDALGTSHPCRHRWTIPDSALTVELSSLRHRAWNFGNAAGRWSRQSARTHCWTLRSVVVDPARRDQSMAFEKARYTLPSWILPDCRTSPLLLGILFGAGFETASQLSALVLAADINPWILGLMFSAGMIMVDGTDGYLASRTQSQAIAGGRRALRAFAVIGDFRSSVLVRSRRGGAAETRH
jgi:hypothetical protein